MTGITRPHYLLDTNAAIAVLENDPVFEAAFSEGQQASVPVIVLGELYAGAEKSAKVEANLRRVTEFESRRSIIPCDAQTARQYARIAQELRHKGRPIPYNDMWIAAIAMQHGMILVTRDAHFNNIDGVLVQSW